MTMVLLNCICISENVNTVAKIAILIENEPQKARFIRESTVFFLFCFLRKA